MNDIKRYHLVHSRQGKRQFMLLDEGKHEIGCFSNGKASIAYTEDLFQADTITDLLLNIRNSGMLCYVVFDWKDADGRYGHEEYPEYMGLNRIDFYDPMLCGIHYDVKPCFNAEWQIDYFSQLWIPDGIGEIKKVFRFSELREEEVDKYAAENKWQKEDN